MGKHDPKPKDMAKILEKKRRGRKILLTPGQRPDQSPNVVPIAQSKKDRRH
jgi:hypothetical protein